MKLGTRQDQAKGVFDTSFEVARISTGLIETEQRLDVFIGHGPPVRPARQRGKDVSSRTAFLHSRRRDDK